uniref:Disease resistance protein RFL1 n=1 Tax=Cajanus cajan TaxID=3821 RepID=A0A151R1F2_CAJCA|nr:Disease resistance protein RFL1 [Cajanus cajan]
MQVNGREASEPTTTIVNEVITALTQPNVIILGMYGSSDARMIKVVDNITRRVQRNGVDKLFDVVVMARVKKKPYLRRIKGKLGNMLGLQLSHKTTLEGRARRLCERIKMKDKILIILDDHSEGINLVRIGIPFVNDHKSCKILLVSHSQEVLSSQMNTQVEISV